MSSSATQEATNSDLNTPKSKKSKKKNKKSKAEPVALNGDVQTPDTSLTAESQDINGDAVNDDSRSPSEPPTPKSPHPATKLESRPLTNGVKSSPAAGIAPPILEAEEQNDNAGPQSAVAETPLLQATTESSKDPTNTDQAERLDALTAERETLRNEVSKLRRSIEELQKKHSTEVKDLQEDVERVQNEKDEKTTQYQNLLGKVNTIRSQLGERLKADAEDLAQARSRIEELEEQNTSLRGQNETREAELASLAEQGEQQSKELSGLRNRTLLSQQNFGKERDDLLQREKYAKEEFEAAKQAMQEWEILAMEERSIRESMQEKVSQLEEQVESYRDAQERAAVERDTQSSTVSGLQRALQELQDARRRELRELVETSQTQVEDLQKQLQEKAGIASDNASKVQKLQEELDRALPFEKEVKEKNLLIGKLRHEAVILSDHLTKILRKTKKGKQEDMIDKQIISAPLLRFLEIDRADPKKFEVLQVIAGMLAWNDEYRERAGLARPGASNPNLRVPLSPWHRTPSTPSLNADLTLDSSSRNESLAELWSEFLEHEADDMLKSPKSPDSTVAGSLSASPKPP